MSNISHINIKGIIQIIKIIDYRKKNTKLEYYFKVAKENNIDFSYFNLRF